MHIVVMHILVHIGKRIICSWNKCMFDDIHFVISGLTYASISITWDWRFCNHLPLENTSNLCACEIFSCTLSWPWWPLTGKCFTSKFVFFIKYSVKNCYWLNCIVLMGWSLLPNALRPFWDLLCSPNVDTRTWICRLILLRDLFFQVRGSLTSLKSQTRDPQPKIPPWGLGLRIFTS